MTLRTVTAPPQTAVRVAADAPVAGERRGRAVGLRPPRLRAGLGRLWPMVAVLIAYAAAAFVVPTLAPVATTDDWAYARSAQILLDEGRLVVFPVVAATAVFPIAWGALFGLLFGPELGAFRLSTVVMVGLGGLALYGLCRQFGVERGRSALAAAAYLFNPLVFVLAFTFMTDPHFTALLVISCYFYARGVAPGRAAAWATVAGSGAAALAFLTRQQGALIVPAVVAFLVIAGGLRPNRAGVAGLLRVAGLPALVIAGYYLWLRFGNDVPVVQESFAREAIEEGWSGTWWLVRRLTVVELVYLGFFALPIAAAALPAVGRFWRAVPPRGWLLFVVWEGILAVGVTLFWRDGRRMPFIGQFFGSGGLGAPDVVGSRPRVLEGTVLDVLTVVCVAASLVLALIAARGLGRPASLPRSRAGLVLAVGLGQVAGVLPPSYHYIGWTAGSLDRYLLPLVPLTLALALWASVGVRFLPVLGWVVVALLALFSTAGTRDYLVYMEGVWGLAREANAAGVANTRLDAGSAWDGFHLYEYGLDEGITRARSPRGSPWWVYFYAKATDSAYVVSGEPVRGLRQVAMRPYSSWLESEPTRLFLFRRPDAPWPPTAPTPTRSPRPAADEVDPPAAPTRAPVPAPPAALGDWLREWAAGQRASLVGPTEPPVPVSPGGDRSQGAPR